MRVEQFLEHHKIARNPFAEEDARTDPVFKKYCIDSTHHPAWQKVMGDPSEPATSIVFGEKGAGKTAMRLQIEHVLTEHNRRHPVRQLFVVSYDDWNPFLDSFRDRFRAGMKIDKVFEQWHLWDHMDAILSLGVTQLVDQVVSGETDIQTLDCHQRRDLILLASCYDHAVKESFAVRAGRLRNRLAYQRWSAIWPRLLGGAITVAMLGLLIVLAVKRFEPLPPGGARWGIGGMAVLTALGWWPWLARWFASAQRAHGIARHLRVIPRSARQLTKVLSRFRPADLTSQPMPNKQRTEDRYELLGKFQGVLQALGYGGIVVMVDRVDEPHLVNGDPERMKGLVWPLLDNKFLKHPGLGLKLMLPADLVPFMESEGRDFHRRARLDKQNVIGSLAWTGEALQDIANARIKACSDPNADPKLRDLFDSSISDARLVEIVRSLRVPRQLFKFLYELVVAHCNSHTDEQPEWQISAAMVESILAVQLRDRDMADNRLRV